MSSDILELAKKLPIHIREHSFLIFLNNEFLLGFYLDCQ